MTASKYLFIIVPLLLLGAVVLVAVSDSDGDTISLWDEVGQHHTDPFQEDTDGDGVGDGVEIQQSMNPLDQDSDGDGVFDDDELQYHTDPLCHDTDADGLDDFDELAGETDARACDRTFRKCIIYGSNG